jgi:hypothetical protein
MGAEVAFVAVLCARLVRKLTRPHRDLCGRLADGGGDVTEGRLKRLSLHDQAEAFDDVAALIALLRDLRTAGRERAAAIKTGLESAWREFTRTAASSR